MGVVIVPEIATQKFPQFSGGTCTPANLGVRFRLHSKHPLNFSVRKSTFDDEAIPTKMDPLSATMGDADICSGSST
jgi:hypothetical protein